MTSNDLYIQKLTNLLRISLKDGKIFLVSCKNPTFSNIFRRAKYVPNTFKLRTQCACLYLFVVYILFAPVISTSIHHCSEQFSWYQSPDDGYWNWKRLTLTLYHNKFTYLYRARGVIAIVVGNTTRRHEFKSWTRLIAFHIALIPLGKVWIQLFSLQLWINSRADWVLQPWWGN